MTYTPTPPSVPGAYWWRLTEDDPARLLQVIMYEGQLWNRMGPGFGPIAKMVGLFSERLVPCDEVEKAYLDGYRTAVDEYFNPAPVEHHYETSRAKRVVEGSEL